MPVLPYRDPCLYRSVEELPGILREEDRKRPLLVTDRGIYALCLTDPLEQSLAAAGYTVTVYADVDQNPTTDMVAKAYAAYTQGGCDCLIAFGGGSAMDCAKAVGTQVARPNRKLTDMAGVMRLRKRIPLLIAVPTTAGTGSETTLAAVIVDSETRHKLCINDFSLIPRHAILDPCVVHTLPSPIMAATGMDALTHAVEAYIGRSTSKVTRSASERATKLIFENIEAASRHESYLADSQMLVAANLAGRAFTRSYVGYIHAVSHSLSGEYNLPHGMTNAVILPIVLEMYGKSVYAPLSRLAVCAGLGKAEEGEEVLAKRFIREVYALNERLGLPRGLKGIREADIPKLARYADREANPLYPVPVLWDAKALEAVYRKVRVDDD